MSRFIIAVNYVMITVVATLVFWLSPLVWSDRLLYIALLLVIIFITEKSIGQYERAGTAPEPEPESKKKDTYEIAFRVARLIDHLILEGRGADFEGVSGIEMHHFLLIDVAEGSQKNWYEDGLPRTMFGYPVTENNLLREDVVVIKFESGTVLMASIEDNIVQRLIL